MSSSPRSWNIRELVLEDRCGLRAIAVSTQRNTSLMISSDWRSISLITCVDDHQERGMDAAK
jgi:hypothetical protein